MSILGCFLPYFMSLIWSRLQGVSRKGYVSKPPVPEDCQANRLHDDAVKKKKDAAKEAATRKRERKEKHSKACKLAQAEGAPRPPMPESTEEEDSSGSEFNFSEPDDYKVVRGRRLGLDGDTGRGKAHARIADGGAHVEGRVEVTHVGGGTRVARAGSE